MIIRVTDGGQFEVVGELEDRVLDLDLALDAAQTSGNEERFASVLSELIELLEAEGENLGREKLVPADLVLPRHGSTLQEWRILLDSEAFEC